MESRHFQKMGVGNDILHEITVGNAVTIQTSVQKSYYEAYNFPMVQCKHTCTSPDAPIYGFLKHCLKRERRRSSMLDVRTFCRVHCNAIIIWCWEVRERLSVTKREP